MSTPTNERTPDARPIAPTPQVDALLSRLASRITSHVFLHGLGTATAFAAAWFLLAFVLDWWLHLPGPIRVFHLVLMFAIPGFFLWRELVRPLARRPDRTGLAVLVERAHPELSQLLVSAVQLSRPGAGDGEPELVASVIRDAERSAAGLSLEPVLDARGPRRRALGGFALAASVVTILLLNGDSARVFLARVAGADVPWPQRTQLFLDVPVAALNAPNASPSGDASVDANAAALDHGNETRRADLRRTVARGSDVPVVVRAEGDVPEEVVLHFQDGHKAVLAAGAGAEFRTVLRSVQGDLTFFATGGDDVDEFPRVVLTVLQPPDVAGLALEIEPPAYSRLPTRVEFDRDVEVLSGSKVVVHVRTDPADATGRARLLPEDRVLPLVPLPYPLTAAQTEAGAQATNALAFEIEPTKSLRFRFELTDSTGLANPDPGLYGITVVEDRAPEVELIAPGRGDFDTVAGGALPLRARAEDDFGVEKLAYTVEAVGAAPEAARPAPIDLPFTPVEVEARREADPARPLRSGVRAAVMGRARLEVAALAPGEVVSEGRQFQLQVVATDVARPKAREGRSSAVRVRVVSSDEFMRRLQDRLSRAQSSTSALAELVRDKNRRTEELIAVLESDSPDAATSDLAAALTGQRRVQGDARALARELCGGAESVLYSRLDDRALAALDSIDAALSLQTARGFDPEPWRELAAASRDRAIAGSGLAGKLVDIAGLSLEISEDLAQGAVEELTAAAAAVELGKVHDHLKKAAQLQKKSLERIDLLLERLAEWDNFQSVLTLTRDILNGQKSISERTRQAAREPK